MNPRPTNNFWISGLSRSNLSPSSRLQKFQLEICAEVRFSSIKTIDYQKKTFHRVSSCYAISRFDLGKFRPHKVWPYPLWTKLHISWQIPPPVRPECIRFTKNQILFVNFCLKRRLLKFWTMGDYEPIGYVFSTG